MLITELFNGQGLGNQLSNYVSVRCLALDKGYEFGVQHPERFKGSSFMNLDMGKEVIGGYTPVEGFKPDLLPRGIDHYYKETTSDYDPEFFNIKDNTSIHGNLQGVNYFKHRKEEIKEWLKVKPLDMPKDLCVINFRGGEYKWVPEFFLPQFYWDLAIAEMKKVNPKMRFEVHTDDEFTARQFFPDFPIVQNMEINWRSIRYAHYLILSNSSFALLPAFLNENVKKVIAPWGMGRFNEGYWLLEQNYVEGWDYIDREGNLKTK